ncbi:hypothetical protein [Cellulophaga baltica]|uniref:hypothetical protein n=1 Tax=Cellulophaga baltica TaxID=76594 RepID=UPI0015F4254F|nr:hypothetical protein [Cellulophaga baltica]MBA6315381.1 carboxypeptidase-like regulatory domain-containing protein [Cellulophaga baltica]
MQLRFSAIILILLLQQGIHGQTIEGKIIDESGTPIDFTVITAKNSEASSLVLAFGISNENGHYKLELKKDIDSLVLEYNNPKYFNKTIKITNIIKAKNLISTITLVENPTKLEEVVVYSKPTPVIVNKDTTNYKIDSFLDGSESVVEDLIKKLPGIRVSDNGQISFKGVPIKSLLLDGDDLFGENYTIGSKNIDVEAIEGLSAIENYQENSLLKDMKKSNAVALNLSLKKSETNFSNGSKIGLGVENKLDLSSTTLGISKKIKTFSTIKYNNIGIDDSPYDYFATNNYNLKNLEKNERNLGNILNDAELSTQLPDDRTRINSTIFSSINTILKITDKIDLKANFDLKKDRLEREILTNLSYFDKNQTEINQSEELKIKPKIYNTKLNFKYILSDKELIEVNSTLENDHLKSEDKVDINGSLQESFINRAVHKNHQILNYTNRIDKNSAFTSSILLNNDKNFEKLNVLSDFNIDSGINLEQTINQLKTYINFENSLLLHYNKFDIDINLGYSEENNKLNSNLNADQTEEMLTNKIDFNKNLIFLNNKFSYRKDKWIFNTSLNLNYLDQNLQDIERLTVKNNTTFYINPKLSIFYKANNKNIIHFSSQYDEKGLDLENTFENSIFNSYRTSTKNSFELETLKYYSGQLTYNYNDFFNLFQLNAGMNYYHQKNNFLSNIIIDDINIVNENLLKNVYSDNISFNLFADKYIGIFKSNFKFNFVQSINNYSNVINSSNLRNNKVFTKLFENRIKTGFVGMFNFEYSLQVRYSTFKSISDISNKSINNSFKIFFRPQKRLNITTTIDYYLPDNRKDNSFSFLDMSLNYSTKNEKLKFSLISRNLQLTGKDYTQRNISDIFDSTTSINLQREFLLLSIDFRL